MVKAFIFWSEFTLISPMTCTYIARVENFTDSSKADARLKELQAMGSIQAKIHAFVVGVEQNITK